MIKRNFVQFPQVDGHLCVLDIGSVTGWYHGAFYTDGKNVPAIVVGTPGFAYYITPESLPRLKTAIESIHGDVSAA